MQNCKFEKNDVYKAMLNRKIRASTELHREVRKLKNAFIEIKRETKNFFETIQANYNSRNSLQFNKNINSDRADFNPKTMCCMDTQGNLQTETQGMLDRCVKHFDQLLNGSNPKENQQMEMVPQAGGAHCISTWTIFPSVTCLIWFNRRGNYKACHSNGNGNNKPIVQKRQQI